MNNEFNFEPNPNGGFAPQEKKDKNGYAIASLVLGIVALLSCCCCCSSGLGLFVMGVSAVLAIVFAFLSKKNTNGKMDAKAIAGLVLGIVAIVVLICLAVAVVGMYAMIDTVPQDELLTMLENTYKPMVDEKTYNDIVESIKAIYAAREN
jgi:Na+/proline symporter